jgi:hypothetical protein
MLTRIILAAVVYFSSLINPHDKKIISNKMSVEQEAIQQENQRIYNRARSASNLYCHMEGSENCYVTCMVIGEGRFSCGIIGSNFHATLQCREEENENRGLYCSDQRTLTQQ